MQTYPAVGRPWIRRGASRSLLARWACLGPLALVALAAPALGVGTRMFATVPFSTGEKPQSKLWYHAGSWWAVLQGPDGAAFYERAGSSWTRGQFVDAILAPSGQADVKWNGTELFVLLYTSAPKLYAYTFDADLRVWLLSAGFPVAVPKPSGSETMVLEQDSTGRLWATAEGGDQINVYYTTSADHRTWSSTPVVLRTGVNLDDIASIVAFGGNKVGVFWSDQNRDEFGFRVHLDGDPPTTWGAVEIADSGSGHADDHINLAFDSSGRVYAITKDDFDAMRVHRRGAAGGWTTVTNVIGGIGTRGILMVSEADARVYILYTRWGVAPERIEYRWSGISTLAFANQTTFISSTADMNNVSGTKQLLPAGALMAVAEDGSDCWFNSFGSPPQPPGPPLDLTATLLGAPARVDLAWSQPATGPADGYDVYRQAAGGAFGKLNGAPVTSTSWTDPSPPESLLCYHVTAFDNDMQGDASNDACVDNTPMTPPGAPQSLVVTLVDGVDVASALFLQLDDGAGQQAADISGNGNDARLGSAAGSDSNDPTWVAGIAGTALQFDGTDDYLEVADAPSLDMPGGFTVEAWVRHTSGTGTIVNKGASGERTYRVLVNSSKGLEFRWETTTGSTRELVVDSAIPDAGWHHVACVYAAAAAENRVYVDGLLLAAAGATGIPASNAKVLSIGARLTSSYRDFLNGAVDEVRITPAALDPADFTLHSGRHAALAWQAPVAGGTPVGYHAYRSVDGGAMVRLTPAPVAATQWNDGALVLGVACYQVTAVDGRGIEGPASDSACVRVLPPPPEAPQGLVAAFDTLPGVPMTGVAVWELDEPSGQTFADATAQGHDGQLGSAAFVDPADPVHVAGFHGNALRFDGHGDRATISDAPDLRFAASFTLEAWVLRCAPDAAGCLASKGAGPLRNFWMRLDAAGRLELGWEEASGAAHITQSAPAVAADGWHHVAGVHDAALGEDRLFVDGVLRATRAAGGTPATGSDPVYLGARAAGGGFTDHLCGCLDLVRFAAEPLYAADFTPPATFSGRPSLIVRLEWQEPAGGTPAGYDIYRQVDGGEFALLDASPVIATAYTDLSPPAGALCYRVTAVDAEAQEGPASDPSCLQLVTDAGEGPGGTDSGRDLGLLVGPNPVSRGSNISFRLPGAGPVRLVVYDVRGRRVVTLVDSPLASGGHVVGWNGRTEAGRPAAAGAYFVVLQAGDRQARRKLVILR